MEDRFEGEGLNQEVAIRAKRAQSIDPSTTVDLYGIPDNAGRMKEPRRDRERSGLRDYRLWQASANRRQIPIRSPVCETFEGMSKTNCEEC